MTANYGVSRKRYSNLLEKYLKLKKEINKYKWNDPSYFTPNDKDAVIVIYERGNELFCAVGEYRLYDNIVAWMKIPDFNGW